MAYVCNTTCCKFCILYLICLCWFLIAIIHSTHDNSDKLWPFYRFCANIYSIPTVLKSYLTFSTLLKDPFFNLKITQVSSIWLSWASLIDLQCSKATPRRGGLQLGMKNQSSSTVYLHTQSVAGQSINFTVVVRYMASMTSELQCNWRNS